MTETAMEKPNLDEVAAAGDGDDVCGDFVGELRAPRDEVLRTRGGGDLAVYERLLRDDQVMSCFQQRRRAAIAREWQVEPGGERPIDIEAADFLREQLQNIRFDRPCEKMLSGLFYGYAVGECLYRAEGGKIHLAAIKVRRAKRFRFDREGRLRLLSRQHPQGEIMPDNKFWVFSAGADDDDDPYGLGLAHYLYWPVWLKRNSLRYWSVFQEKFAMPTPVGKAPRGADKAQRNKLLAALKAIATDSAVVVPEGVEIALMEAKRAAGNDYDTFYRLMNEAIAKIILSQTMTTDNGSSKAQGQVHADVKMEVVKSDNDLLCESFNDGPATWLTHWNFPGAAVPRVWRDHSEEEDKKERADRDKVIYEMGYDLTPEYVAEIYGPGFVKRAAAPNAQPAAPAMDFAEPGAARDPADDIADQLEAVVGGALTALIDELGRMLDDAHDLPTVEKRLLEIGAALDVSAVATPLAEALAVASLTGRGEVADGG